jgi:hypothetical protein
LDDPRRGVAFRSDAVDEQFKPDKVYDAPNPAYVFADFILPGGVVLRQIFVKGSLLPFCHEVMVGDRGYTVMPEVFAELLKVRTAVADAEGGDK